MSFTALHPDVGRLDATDPELGCGLPWAAAYKVRPRVPLTCPDCGHGVHARRSSRGLRHFAHDPQRPEQCELAGESMEHHLLKLQLACAIRESGWHAELEVAAPDGTWRADVMASSPDGGRRIAWEAQLSAITVDDIRDRTERYFEAAVEVCWVTTRKETPWMGRVPSVRVDGEEGRWRVNDGIAGFDSRAGRWEVRPVPLGSLVVWVHSGRLDFHAVLPRYRRVLRPADGGFARRPGLWTSSRSVEAELQHERRRSSPTRPSPPQPQPPSAEPAPQPPARRGPHPAHHLAQPPARRNRSAELVAGRLGQRGSRHRRSRTSDRIGQDRVAGGRQSSRSLGNRSRSPVGGHRVPSQMISSGSRAVTCGDQINRDAGPQKISSDLVPEVWMLGAVSVDLVRP